MNVFEYKCVAYTFTHKKSEIVKPRGPNRHAIFIRANLPALALRPLFYPLAAMSANVPVRFDPSPGSNSLYFSSLVAALSHLREKSSG